MLTSPATIQPMVPHVETKRVEISSEINLVDISLNENTATAKTAIQSKNILTARAKTAIQSSNTVSYTHLTLPTNREV